MEPVIYKGETQHNEERIHNVEFAIKKAEHFLKKGEMLKAERALERYYQRQISDNTLPSDLESTIVNSTQFIKEAIPEPYVIISPWLTDGNINMIYGLRGTGKTWLALIIAVAVTRKNAGSLSIGPWQVNVPTGVFYIDGEMGEYELQKRLKLLSQPLEMEDEEFQLDILSANRYVNKSRRQLSISDEEYRGTISKILEDNEQYKLLILDNIASLTPGIDENSKKAWDPINRWLISLRHLGVAVIMVHHAGKNETQRGTSAREDALDCVINLSRKSAKGTTVGTNFELEFEKSRNLPPNISLNPFTLKLVENDQGGLTWVADRKAWKPEHEIVIGLLMDKKLKQKKIAELMKIAAPMVTKIKKKAINEGLIDDDCNATQQGEEFYNTLKSKHNLDKYYSN
jgi:putative DNA primase/helicase